jgi:hypothetical protein
MRIYKTIILPVILYGCEREGHRLRVFENKVLGRIFGPKRDEVTGGWRKLHNDELRDLYSSPSIIRIMKSRRMRWAGHVARMNEKRNVYMLSIDLHTQLHNIKITKGHIYTLTTGLSEY